MTSTPRERPTLRLLVRTPSVTVLDERVRALTAEDSSGRFGVRPGSDAILSALLPGILCFRGADDVETVIAVGPGVLLARRDRVDVMVEEATLCGSLQSAEAALAAALQHERGQRAAMRDLFARLHQNLVRALARQEPRE